MTTYLNNPFCIYSHYRRNLWLKNLDRCFTLGSAIQLSEREMEIKKETSKLQRYIDKCESILQFTNQLVALVEPLKGTRRRKQRKISLLRKSRGAESWAELLKHSTRGDCNNTSTCWMIGTEVEAIFALKKLYIYFNLLFEDGNNILRGHVLG